MPITSWPAWGRFSWLLWDRPPGCYGVANWKPHAVCCGSWCWPFLSPTSPRPRGGGRRKWDDNRGWYGDCFAPQKPPPPRCKQETSFLPPWDLWDYTWSWACSAFIWPCVKWSAGRLPPPNEGKLSRWKPSGSL